MNLFMSRGKGKVFCIGRNKTGTTSIEKTLRDFGYKLGNQVKAELLIHDYSKGNWKPIINFCKSADAFQDVPFSWPNTWVVLYEHFPEAKYILTVRDENEWYKSITNFHKKKFGNGERIPLEIDLKNARYRYKGFIWDANRAVWKTPVNNLYEEKTFKENYKRHNDSIRHFFDEKNNFLEIDLANDKSYKQLCYFLNKKPLHQTFPHLNKT